MIFISIPGKKEINISNLVLDYNGTVAVDGILNPKIKEYIKDISKYLNVYIITADTYGNVKDQCEGLPIKVDIFSNGNATFYKKKFVERLGKENTMVVGNGMNDIEMFKLAAISVAIIGEEGCAGKLILQSDIVVKDIYQVFNMIKNKNRIIATLRD